MCIHPDIVKTMNGWYCPACKQTFAEKPTEKITILNVEEPKEAETEEKPKPKKKTTNSKSAAKK